MSAPLRPVRGKERQVVSHTGDNKSAPATTGTFVKTVAEIRRDCSGLGGQRMLRFSLTIPEGRRRLPAHRSNAVDRFHPALDLRGHLISLLCTPISFAGRPQDTFFISPLFRSDRPTALPSLDRWGYIPIVYQRGIDSNPTHKITLAICQIFDTIDSHLTTGRYCVA
jgi:hypothetical protein